jgi:hypothetical protein
VRSFSIIVLAIAFSFTWKPRQPGQFEPGVADRKIPDWRVHSVHGSFDLLGAHIAREVGRLTHKLNVFSFSVRKRAVGRGGLFHVGCPRVFGQRSIDRGRLLTVD